MITRRKMLATGVAVGATTWVAPSVLTFERSAAAAGSAALDVPVATNGAIVIAPPPDMTEGTLPLDSNTNTYVWLESACAPLANDLVVNRTAAGSFNGNSNAGTIIPAGTQVASYLVHGDRLDDSGTLTGTITFAGGGTILGLIYRTAQLNASNYLLAPGTIGTPQAMEVNDTMVLDLTAGANSLSWSMRFGPALDNIRVIMACC